MGTYTNKKITAAQLKPEHIQMVNDVISEANEEILSKQGYVFYYNALFVYDLDLCDADRYANLNTILGYDIGIRRFRAIDGYLYAQGGDLIELTGSEKDLQLLKNVCSRHNLKEIDCSHWRNLSKTQYTYSYFEKGKEYK